MMDVVMNFIELMEDFGVEAAVAIALFIAAFAMIFAVYKEKVLKYILHERNVLGFAFSLIYAGVDLLLSRFGMISHRAFYELLFLDVLYLACCIYLIKHPSLYAKKKLDEMERRFNEGDILENKEFFRKKPSGT